MWSPPRWGWSASPARWRTIFAADDVTANLVSPGLIATPRDPGAPTPQHTLTHDTLSGRHGGPDDIAATVRFLCGPGARYITGQTVHVNGGASLSL